MRVDEALQDNQVRQKVDRVLQESAKKEGHVQTENMNELMELGLAALETDDLNPNIEHDLALATREGTENHLRARNSLFNSWILDGAGGRHICNDSMKDRLTNVRHNQKGFLTGETVTTSRMIGSWYINVNTPFGQRRVPISDVSFIPGFHCNILSSKLLRKKGIYLNERRMEQPHNDGRCLMKVNDVDGMLVIEHVQVDYAFATPQKANRPSKSPPIAHGTTELWHRRFAHISNEAVSHILRALAGAIVTDNVMKKESGLARTVCETCSLTKLNQPLSRRPRERGVRPFQVLSVDLIHVTKHSFDGSRYVAHAIDDATRAHISMATSTRADLAGFVKRVVAYVEKQAAVQVRKIHFDHDTTMTSFDTDKWSGENAIQIRASAPYTHQIVVAAAERAGQQLCNIARAFHIESRLPSFLWPEGFKAASYIANRTPLLS